MNGFAQKISWLQLRKREKGEGESLENLIVLYHQIINIKLELSF